MSTTQVPLVQATVTKDEATNLTVIELSLVALAAALGAPAQQGGSGSPRPKLVSAGGLHTTATIPTGTKLIHFITDVAAYVSADQSASDPFATDDGMSYPANLPLQLPCNACTKLHLKAAGAVTLRWTALA